jgi:hypothetical protein
LNNKEKMLTTCLEEIKSGKLTIEEYFALNPAARSEIEPLLKLALNIRVPLEVSPDPEFNIRAKSKILSEIIARKRSANFSFFDLINSFKEIRTTGWAKMALVAVTVMLAISITAGSTVYASQNSLPGDLLYPVKQGTEEVRRIITADDVSKIELEMEYARFRLQEMNDLSDRTPERVILAVNGYRYNLTQAITETIRLQDSAKLNTTLEALAAEISRQIAFCDSAGQRSSTIARESISLASTFAVGGQITVLRKLATENLSVAAQINRQEMQNRLQRIQVLADINDYTSLPEVLRQYQQLGQFGDQILQIAHESGTDSIDIGKSYLQAISDDLETLKRIYQQVPGEFQGAIGEAQGMSLELQQRAKLRLSESDNNSSPEAPAASEKGGQDQGDFVNTPSPTKNGSTTTSGNGGTAEPANTGIPEGPQGNSDVEHSGNETGQTAGGDSGTGGEADPVGEDSSNNEKGASGEPSSSSNSGTTGESGAGKH